MPSPLAFGARVQTFRVLRPAPAYDGQPPATEKHGEKELFPFGKCEINRESAMATATYSTCRVDSEGVPMYVPVYEAKKPKGMRYQLAVESADGVLVAKISQEHLMYINDFVGEIGQGVDIVAIILIAAFVGTATSSTGSAIGGLTGANGL